MLGVDTFGSFDVSDTLFIGGCMSKLDPWLGDFYGIKPHRNKHDGSFNNIVFSTEYIMARLESKTLVQEDLTLYLSHIHLTNTPDGLYAPKSSHDNLTAKITGLLAVQSKKVNEIDLSKAAKGQHPRDRILYGFLLRGNIFDAMLLPLALLDIVRAILDSGKVRPKFWDNWETFKFRAKAKLGLIKPNRTEKIFGGEADIFVLTEERVIKRIIRVQNDGKILNLLRLNALRKFKLLRPFVRLCKRLYIKKLGPNFQSVLFANYFEEVDHPVRAAFAELDKAGKTIIDC